MIDRLWNFRYMWKIRCNFLLSTVMSFLASHPLRWGYLFFWLCLALREFLNILILFSVICLPPIGIKNFYPNFGTLPIMKGFNGTMLLFSFTISYILMHLNPFMMLYSFSYKGQWVCFVVTSFLVIQWSSIAVKESPQVLALSPPPMFTSRQVLTICNVWFEKISSKKSFSKKPRIPANAKLYTMAELQLVGNNNHLLGVDLKLSCYFVDDHAFVSFITIVLVVSMIANTRM